MYNGRERRKEMAVVYIDVLFAVNFIINILLIEASGVICSVDTLWYRSLLSAAFGAFYSVLIFFPDLKILYTLVMKIVFSGFMVICAFQIGSLRQFFSLWGAFYAVSFVFGGCLMALMSMTDIGRKSSAVYSNGVIYFDLPWQYLFLSTLISYALIIIIGRVRRKRQCRAETKGVLIYVNGQCVKVTAIIDTGNSLFDPITGEPVAVCESEALRSLLGSGDEPIIEKMAQKGLKVRYVPFSSVGKSNGIMPGFKPDMVKVDGKEAEECVICVCENRLSNTREYRALLNPQLIK
jgi:stage II sporulation protein GA (sporulation sigma-E factor processing peptidase)